MWLDPVFWRKMLISPFGFWFASLVILCCQRSGLYRRKAGVRLRYAKPLQGRVFFVLFAAGLLWMLLLLRPLSQLWPLDIFYIGIAAGALYMAGPGGMWINLENKTYLAKHGGPLVSVSWRGRLNDILGVKVVKNYNNTWMLMLCWRTRQDRIVTGRFSRQQEAEAAACQVTKDLGIDIPVSYKPSFNKVHER